MSLQKSIERVSVHPLFYDALSGEFTPPSDPEHRRHTLGRLAFAGLTKGELTTSDHRMLGVDPVYDPVIAVYRPSWAPRVETRVLGAIHRQDLNCNLVGIELQNEEGDELIVVNSADSWQMTLPGERKGPGATVVYGELSLGNALQYAQAKIAQETQQFFAASS